MTHSSHPSSFKITDGFWAEVQNTNAETAIFHQWNQLEMSGSIENFRIASGYSCHFRSGDFFSDSDIYKWLDAACRIMLSHPSAKLKALINELSALIQQAQMSDGYLFTYNQIHFPNQRWIALQIEHELYCHGHLIEACLAHQRAFLSEDMLQVAVKAADRICADFLDKPAQFQPGHQEIELALLELYEITDNLLYLQMACQFLERRGKVTRHGFRLLGTVIRSASRAWRVKQQRKAHSKAHPDLRPFTLPPMNKVKSNLGLQLRFLGSAFSGRYFQTHRPILEQTEAVGHSVRFGYTMAAQARLLRLTENSPGLDALDSLWRRMVTKRTYVTGGLGSLPIIEGFGKDYELDPALAYAETCATIASLFWDWEMLLATGNPAFTDMFEWQLYNAALVGVGLDGQSYLYNNPLTSDGELTREPWFRIPCCPSNLSRVFASLGKYAVTWDNHTLTIHQYFSGEFSTKSPTPLQIAIDSGFPWKTTVQIKVTSASDIQPNLALRVPGWATGVRITLNDHLHEIPFTPQTPPRTASGYSPFGAETLTLPHKLHSGDRISIDFEAQVRAHKADLRVGLAERSTALTFGPLIYCAESVDNPDVDLDAIRLDPHSFSSAPSESLKGILTLKGKTTDGQPITLIPYFSWANRGPSRMRVFFRS